MQLSQTSPDKVSLACMWPTHPAMYQSITCRGRSGGSMCVFESILDKGCEQTLCIFAVHVSQLN
jgi:hypothetical protein